MRRQASLGFNPYLFPLSSLPAASLLLPCALTPPPAQQPAAAAQPLPARRLPASPVAAQSATADCPPTPAGHQAAHAGPQTPR